MATTWKKLGRIFDPNESLPDHERLVTHAANPTAIPVCEQVVRVLFNSRDEFNRSSVGFFDLNLKTLVVQNISQVPIFTWEDDTFYSAGISTGCILSDGGLYKLYFMGWNYSGADLHWRGDVGVVDINVTDSDVEVFSPELIIGESEIDPISVSYPWVYRKGDDLEMIYGSTICWVHESGEMIHCFNRATKSQDKVVLHGQEIPFIIGHAQAFSRPTGLVRDDGTVEMWFSYRGRLGVPYRIGKAVKRRPDANWVYDFHKHTVHPSEKGWDSEMICYPNVFEAGGEVFMLYNGNGYGQSGIGLAILENSQ